jgi:hypothetical protein
VNVAVRELWRGRVWRIMAYRVVAERDGVTIAWSPAGTPVLRPFAAARELRVPGDLDWQLEARPSAWEQLALLRPGARHTLYLFFERGRFSRWYVNFERESQWRGRCFDIVDEKLDLVVAADGTERLKDEDELADAARAGYLDEDDVRAQLAAVRADPPWPTGWEEWRPDAAWTEPELPDGWDVV